MAKLIQKSKKRKPKRNYKDIISRLKILNRYLFNPNEELIPKIFDTKTEFFSSYIYRLYSLIESQPLLLIYVDEYLNDFSVTSYEPEHIMKSFAILLNLFNIHSPNELYYNKFKVNHQEQFYKQLIKYFEEYDFQVNSRDLLALYHLFNNNIITETQMNEYMDIIEGKSTTKKTKLPSQQLLNVQDIIQKSKVSKNELYEIPPKIQELNNNIINYIKNTTLCKECQLYKAPKVLIDSNINDYENGVDIMFIGINPGNEEIKLGRPFIGPSGELVRGAIAKLSNIRYAITNIIPCHTSNESDIPKALKNGSKCKHITDKILDVFKPRLIVLFGLQPCRRFGLKGTMAKLNGELQDNKYLPIVHPSAVIRQAKNASNQFVTGFATLSNLLNNNEIHQPSPEDLVPDFNIPPEKTLTKFSPDLTLFDISIVNDKIIYIMIDKNGVKKYIIKDYIFPIYIKYGDYKDCHYIETNVECVANLTAKEKRQLRSKLYHNLTKTITL